MIDGFVGRYIVIDFYAYWDEEGQDQEVSLIAFTDDRLFNVVAAVGCVSVAVSVTASILCGHELLTGLGISKTSRRCVIRMQVCLVAIYGVCDFYRSVFFIYSSLCSLVFRIRMHCHLPAA